MKKWLIFMTLLISIHAYSEEEEEMCLCGTVNEDVDYARAVFLLKLSIRKSPLWMGGSFPDVAAEFYPPFEVREELDDSYPYEGRISWDVIKECRWPKDQILKHPNEDGVYAYPQNHVNLPVRVERKVEYSKSANVSGKKHENTVFSFQRRYAAVPRAFDLLKRDVEFFYRKNEEFLDARVVDLSKGATVYRSGVFDDIKVKPQILLERKLKNQSSYAEILYFIEQKETEAVDACKASLDWCIENHGSPFAYVNCGLFHYLEGNDLDALEQIKSALSRLKPGEYERLRKEAVFMKGQAELEIGLYGDAVLTLSELINDNPTNSEAYFERAIAYFELGNFELCLQDYLLSGVKSQLNTKPCAQITAFSHGLARGALRGGTQSTLEFIPSCLSTLQGLGQGLWAFAGDPVEISIDLAQAAWTCVNFVKDHTPRETLTLLVPELKELIDNWNECGDEDKGEITGHIIGKYGVEIFSGVGLTKAMKAYRQLKKANNLLTFEAMAISERNRSIIRLEAIRRGQARREVLRHANLKIQWDKQGKHIVDHNNYELFKNRSILIHSDPQRLVNEFAGKGLRIGHKTPGRPGYIEIVDFGEFIGYEVDFKTGDKLATSWGKLHYAGDGVHIVPTKPRSTICTK
ncbi:MAG: hypothetical protein JSS61_00310 [Verrucomicrobia bacterium]|nr:hypothetical protein [Verrucomicrobiota bacterium]